MPAPFSPCDVAMVAEFDVWETAASAEARAVFFLASWIDAGGEDCPLHLICVGQPPASVQSLARRAGARVRVCERQKVNALHALEATAETGRLLLVSADTLALSSCDGWNRAPAEADLLLVPANKPPSPEPDWPALYQAAGLTVPAERVWPFFQAGTLWTSSPAALREKWARCLERVGDERIVLTLARQAMGASNRLPEPYCARLASWESGTLAPSETRLFQAAGLFQGLIDLSEIPSRMETYGARLEAAVQSGFADQGWWARQRAGRGARKVRRQLARWFRQTAAPALREGGAYV